MKSAVKFAAITLAAAYLAGTCTVQAADAAAEAKPDLKAQVKELVALVDKAAKLVAEKGDASFAAINDPKGDYNKGSLYVFVIAFDGETKAHGNPKLLGKNMMTVKDTTGKIFAADFVAIAKTDAGKGWSEYMWLPKPTDTTPQTKVSYVVRVPGKDLVVGAGMFGVTKAQAEEMSK